MRLGAQLAYFDETAGAAHTQKERAGRAAEDYVDVDVHVISHSVVYSGRVCRQNVCSWYIALEKHKHENNAAVDKLYGFEGDGG